jgi:nitroreductase
MNELVQMMKTRRSVRQFEAKPIPSEIIEDILDCAQLAPTAINIQPWLFGAVTGSDLRRQIAALTDYGKFIENCAVCFAVFTDSSTKYFLEDDCAATENILLACTAYGIGSCWVAGHKKAYADSVKKLLNVPEPYTLISLIAAGYSKQKQSLKKKSLDEVSFLTEQGEGRKKGDRSQGDRAFPICRPTWLAETGRERSSPPSGPLSLRGSCPGLTAPLLAFSDVRPGEGTGFCPRNAGRDP